jgi:pimeloyl-ACP methyl ester carboxylesterase
VARSVQDGYTLFFVAFEGDMPEALVRGVHINYEVVGSNGPWVALTPGSRRNYHELIDLSKDIASAGYQVLLHDRRNCGASDVAFDDTASEHEIWADDLYRLGEELGGQQMYVGGSSAGARLALLFAIRHPNAVLGLLLWRVTGGKEAVNKLADAYYGSYIRLAQRGGMEAVCTSEHFQQCIDARPINRERLLKTDVTYFIRVMSYWQERFCESASLPIVGATESDLRSLNAPACVISGNDIIHTPDTANKVARLIRGSELHDDIVSRRPESDLLKDWDRQEWKEQEKRMAEIFTRFLAKAEASRRKNEHPARAE